MMNENEKLYVKYLESMVRDSDNKIVTKSNDRVEMVKLLRLDKSLDNLSKLVEKIGDEPIYTTLEGKPKKEMCNEKMFIYENGRFYKNVQ